MKRLSIVVVLLVVLFSVAFAHDGAISLFTDETATDCDTDVNLYQSFDVYVIYIKDNGPYLGKALQFKLEKSNPSGLNKINETWIPEIILTIGDVDNGVSLTASDCLGTSSETVYIGKVTYLSLSNDSMTVKVVDDPNAAPDPGIFITLCEEGDPMYRVLGGTFVLNGSCNVAVEDKSWGAIKSLYK